MLKKICTDSESSLKLKELGIIEKTFFYWWQFKNDEYVLSSEDEWIDSSDVKNKTGAYTLETLLKMLPYTYEATACLWDDGDEEDNLATTTAKMIIREKENEVK